MGVKVPLRQFNITFPDDPPLEEGGLKGVEVKVRSLTVRQYSELSSVFDLSRASEMDARLKDIFSKQLVSWNLDDENGEPIPASREGLEQIEAGAFARILGEWRSQLISVPRPLQNGSVNGASSEDMTALANLPTSQPS